jgi:hypothetical protein
MIDTTSPHGKLILAVFAALGFEPSPACAGTINSLSSVG